MGGGPSAFPSMFQSFSQDSWPGLPGSNPGRTSNRRNRGPDSIAGESVAPSEITDAASSIAGTRGGMGQRGGGVSLGANLHDALGSMRPTSYSHSDRLRAFVENSGRYPPGNGFGTRRYDDDEKSISTSFASQVGGGYD